METALQAALAFDMCIRRLNDSMRAGEKLACGPAGGYFKGSLALYQDYAQRMVQLLSDSKPRTRCGQCAGSGCEACRELGYVCASSA